MNNFREQIEEDIRMYQKDHPYISNIKKDEWAFNYWVMDKFFYEDEELIEDKIIDYNDKAIDCYETYEDTKEVYLIQNKYYSDSSKLDLDYVENDFLIRGITALENGTYPRSEELQKFFSKYKDEENFVVHLQLYITNNNKIVGAEEAIKDFNSAHPKYRAEIYYLDDIEKKYWDEPKENKVELRADIYTVNKATQLNINNEKYKLSNIVDARYVFAPVKTVYDLFKKAIEKGYPIFDENIREYLGNKGINNNIYKTLIDENDRKNFFYYNNGITIICDSMTAIDTHGDNKNNLNAKFTVVNPQIVNGCQTVNSIFAALSNTVESQLLEKYKDAFVMLKILQIDRSSENHKKLYEDIVKFNNSQNSLDEKLFAANKTVFYRLQDALEEYGFLLLVKQSDKNTFKNTYKNVTKLKEKSEGMLNKFGIPDFKKVDDFFIPLDKLLQVICAFLEGGHTAYVKKNVVLKFDSEQYKKGIDFIKNNETSTTLDLYLLYRRAEIAKKASKDSRSPIPYYLIDGFARFECKDRKSSNISTQLSSKKDIDAIIKLYQLVSFAYCKIYYETYNVDYNKMIKQPIDKDIFDSQRDTFKASLEQLL